MNLTPSYSKFNPLQWSFLQLLFLSLVENQKQIENYFTKISLSNKNLMNLCSFLAKHTLSHDLQVSHIEKDIKTYQLLVNSEDEVNHAHIKSFSNELKWLVGLLPKQNKNDAENPKQHVINKEYIQKYQNDFIDCYTNFYKTALKHLDEKYQIFSDLVKFNHIIYTYKILITLNSSYFSTYLGYLIEPRSIEDNLNFVTKNLYFVSEIIKYTLLCDNYTNWSDVLNFVTKSLIKKFHNYGVLEINFFQELLRFTNFMSEDLRNTLFKLLEEASKSYGKPWTDYFIDKFNGINDHFIQFVYNLVDYTILQVKKQTLIKQGADGISNVKEFLWDAVF